MSKTKDRFNELASDVASRLIDQLEKGTAPWQKPWSSVIHNPHNPITGSQYSGANWLFLQMISEAQGFSDPRWMTFKQITDAGGTVKKGSRGAPCLYWADKWLDLNGQPISAQEARDLPSEAKQRIMIPCRFTVFNAEQTEGLDLPEWKAPKVTWDPDERAEKILKASRANITNKFGNQAFYSPLSDTITLPERGQFAKASDYYDTALHELGHWTGHESRLNRDLSARFGTPGYAKEELRAEIASMMLASEIGLPHNTLQHAAYVSSWIKVLKEDPTEIIRAAADAQKITDFVKNLEKERYYVVDYEKNAVLRLTHPELVSGIRRTLSSSPEALAKFESLIAPNKHKALSQEYKEKDALGALLNPTNPQSLVFTSMTRHRGIAATQDAHLFIGLAKLQPGLEDKAFRFLQRLEGKEKADKARADWEAEEKQNSTIAQAFVTNSSKYWQTLDKKKEKTPLETALAKLHVADKSEQQLIAKETMSAIRAEKRFYLIDFEANTVNVVTHRELLEKANDIFNENSAAKHVRDEVLSTADNAGTVKDDTDPALRERQTVRQLLDPTLPRPALDKCPINHAGLFYTDKPLQAITIASLRSPELAEKATALIAQVDSGISVDEIRRHPGTAEFGKTLSAQRQWAEHYWKTLDAQRQHVLQANVPPSNASAKSAPEKQLER